MRILYLYSEIMGYQIPVLKEYLKIPGCNISVISWDRNKLTPYTIPDIPGIRFLKRSEFTFSGLKEFCDGFSPDIIYTSGWMDRDYVRIAKYQKKKGIPVIAGLDVQWKGSLRQIVASIISPFYFRKAFTHFFVAGPYQYEYAKKLGYSNSEIIFNCYSADVQLFNKAFLKSIEIKRRKYPHKFLFVGRFSSEKGINILIEAFNDFIIDTNSDWKLLIIGNGPEKYQITENIEIKDFMLPDRLVEEFSDCGCCILPSKYEPWGVVLHEFSAAGMPIIASVNCGANAQLLINGYNGFSIEPVKQSIKEALVRISSLTDSQLIDMSLASNKLSKRIDPEITAKSFLSALK